MHPLERKGFDPFGTRPKGCGGGSSCAAALTVAKYPHYTNEPDEQEQEAVAWDAGHNRSFCLTISFLIKFDR